MKIEDLIVRQDGIDTVISYEIETQANIPIRLEATNVRNESTGVHGEISIMFDGADVYTIGNLKRREVRNPLITDIYKHMGPTKEDAEYVLPKKILTDEFNTFCKLVYPKMIHVNAPEYVEGSAERILPDFTASPHVLNGGGTVMYGKPGMGKSYTALAMAISVNEGCSKFWNVKKQKALYVNLERDRKTMPPRIGKIRSALGLDISGSLAVHNVKESTLMEIRDPLMRFINENDIEFLIIDSLSQTGKGDMKEDTVASETVKMLNKMGVSWLAVAHTPKYDSSTYFGSAMWEAGADAMLRHSSDIIDDKGAIEVLLDVTKANDMPIPKPMRLHYSFDKFGLANARFANQSETVELELENNTVKPKEKVRRCLAKGLNSIQGVATSVQIDSHEVKKLIDSLESSSVVHMAKRINGEEFYALTHRENGNG